MTSVRDRFKEVESAVDHLGAGEHVVLIDEATPRAKAWLLRIADDIEVGDIATMIATAGGSLRIALSSEHSEDIGPPAPRSGIGGWPLTPRTATPGGVLAEEGWAEAATDLAHLAGCDPVVGICAITRPTGGPGLPSEARALAAERGMPVVTLADLIAYRLNHDRTLKRVASARLPTPRGEFQAIGYSQPGVEHEYLALVAGAPRRLAAPLVHIHRHCRFGDTFRSLECGCRRRLEGALDEIFTAGAGIVVYLPSDDEIPGIHRAETTNADRRAAVQMISDLRVRSITLLSQSPLEAADFARYGIDVADEIDLA